MKKTIALFSILICLCILTSCIGTPVIYNSACTCPTGGAGGSTVDPETEMPANGLKTGLAIISNIKKSKSATATENGMGEYDLTLVAVTVDRSGILHGCIIDSIGTSVKFDHAGQITSDKNATIQTKNEQGDSYGMAAASGIGAEWYKQAGALAEFAVGKTVTELKNGAIDQTGYAPDGTDLASEATIYLGGYVSAIEAAASNATYLGASIGDTLHFASLSDVKGSANFDPDPKKGYGLTQLETTATAMTMKNGVITSCAIDSVQAKVQFDATGNITTDLGAKVKTKNELGPDYNMVKYGYAMAEWNVQVASFAQYVTGKTPAEVANIAVDTGTKPTGADLVSSVTIAVGGFQALIQKAAQ